MLRFWGAAPPPYSNGNITAVTTTNYTNDKFEVWTCMDSSIVKWTVMKEGWEQVCSLYLFTRLCSSVSQLEYEEDIQEVLVNAFINAFPNSDPIATFDLELLDLAFDSYVLFFRENYFHAFSNFIVRL